jgi:hypothetical protein
MIFLGGSERPFEGGVTTHTGYEADLDRITGILDVGITRMTDDGTE